MRKDAGDNIKVKILVSSEKAVLQNEINSYLIADDIREFEIQYSMCRYEDNSLYYSVMIIYK